MNDKRIYAKEEISRKSAKELNKELQTLKRQKGVFERRRQADLAKECEKRIQEKLKELQEASSFIED